MWNKKSLKQVFSRIDNKWLLVGVAFIILVIFGFTYFGNLNANQGPQNNPVQADSAESSPGLSEDEILIEAIYAELGGETVQTQTSFQAGESQGFWYYFFRILISLAIVVILIYVTVMMLRFFTKNRSKNQAGMQQSKGFIKKIESFDLGGNKSIHLINAAGKYLLIGSGEKDINIISELSAEKINEFKVLNNISEASTPSNESFKSVFFDVFKKGNLKKQN